MSLGEHEALVYDSLAQRSQVVSAQTLEEK